MSNWIIQQDLSTSEQHTSPRLEKEEKKVCMHLVGGSIYLMKHMLTGFIGIVISLWTLLILLLVLQLLERLPPLLISLPCMQPPVALKCLEAVILASWVLHMQPNSLLMVQFRRLHFMVASINPNKLSSRNRKPSSHSNHMRRHLPIMRTTGKAVPIASEIRSNRTIKPDRWTSNEQYSTDLATVSVFRLASFYLSPSLLFESYIFSFLLWCFIYSIPTSISLHGLWFESKIALVWYINIAVFD